MGDEKFDKVKCEHTLEIRSKRWEDGRDYRNEMRLSRYNAIYNGLRSTFQKFLLSIGGEFSNLLFNG